MESQRDGRYCHLSKDQPPSSPQGYGGTVAKVPPFLRFSAVWDTLAPVPTMPIGHSASLIIPLS